MSDVENIKKLEETSPQSSWIFVDDCDVNTTQNKYYLNCSTEPVTELTEPAEKKGHESDSDSISIISESDDGKEAITESNEVTETGPLVKENRDVPENAVNVLHGRLYAFGCILLAVILPILLNYVMYSSNEDDPTYLTSSDKTRSDDSERLSLYNEKNVEDSETELVNVNLVTEKDLRSYNNQLKQKAFSNLKDSESTNKIKINLRQTAQHHIVFDDTERETKHNIQYEEYKTKIKNKSEKYSKKKSKQYKSSDMDKKFKKKEKETFKYKKVKNKRDKPKPHTQDKEHSKPSCDKQLSKLKHVLVNQAKQIRELNKSLKDRERQLKIMQHKIFQEIKELKFLRSETNGRRRNFTRSVSGEWYDSYFEHRDKTRKRTHEADWFFDRAYYRQKKRVPDKNWYINWMLQRENIRKRTDWHGSF